LGKDLKGGKLGAEMVREARAERRKLLKIKEIEDK